VRRAQGGIEGLEGPLARTTPRSPLTPRLPGQHEPGAEFGTATGRVEPESDSSDEIDAASNQSLVPSSLGMTFCVDGDAERIEIEARWGRYERSDEHEIFRTRKNKETGPSGPRPRSGNAFPVAASSCCRSPKA
jgi:hypothetical protein